MNTLCASTDLLCLKRVFYCQVIDKCQWDSVEYNEWEGLLKLTPASIDNCYRNKVHELSVRLLIHLIINWHIDRPHISIVECTDLCHLSINVKYIKMSKRNELQLSSMSEKVRRLSIITIVMQFLCCPYIYWLLQLSIGISIGYAVHIFITFCSFFHVTRQIAQGKARFKLFDALSWAQISANPTRFIPGRT